ncbi:MAG: 2OG-Fe(II) oxygenase [Acetobacteraceae bacterium]|nr:2OG-Fe(II) oxygenase [Acetobacteraceae bacterium]
MAETAQEYRAEVGAWVCDRLEQNPDAQRIVCDELDVFVVRNFLTPEECATFIALIDADRVPSGLLAPSEDPEFRTSESCNFKPDIPDVIALETKYHQVFGIQPEFGEGVQGQRYAPGQQFKPHHDYFHRGTPYWDDMEASGGQRTWTGMAFLNVPGGGGHTIFPEVGIKVTPRAGNLLIWNNMGPDGLPNPKSLHQGSPVTAGLKYVITKWYRERTWGYQPAAAY